MKVPNIHAAAIDRSKIVDYLLSKTHAVGRHKAGLFRGFGFTVERWQELAAALRNQAAHCDTVREEPSEFGRRFVAEGIIETPDGRRPMVRSIWFVRNGEETTRFVTAYPLKSPKA